MTSRKDEIPEQRLEKLAGIRELGASPYPNTFHRSHTAAQAVALLEKIEAGTASRDRVVVAGRVMANRSMGKSSFIDIRDDSGKIQLLFMNTRDYDENKLKLFRDLDIGDVIGVKGEVLRTRTGEPTVRVADFSMLAKSLRPLPEKWHGLSDVDIRFRQRYLDLIANPEARETFRTRSGIIAAVRQYFNKKGFIEVETPVLLPHAGGALAAPFITHHNALDQDFFLRIATELHLKRLIVGGFDKVYEIGHMFRNEGVSTRHNPEFTLLESYEAYADYQDVMEMVEDLVSTVARQVLGTTEVKYGDDVIDLAPPWPRVPLRDAVKQYSGIDFVQHPSADGLREKMRSMNIEAPADKNWPKLVDELLTTCVKPQIVQPTFLVDYPVSMSPLAKSKPGEERVVERFQAYAGRGLEFANAYSELNDPIEQRLRFEEQMKERQGDDPEKWTIDEDFLTALEYGMPPTGGLGIGLDRLVMLLTDQHSIREVILFPQLRDK